jgi:hypothetical protein
MGPNAGFRTRLMRAIHAEAKKRGIDHDGLHDIAVMRWGHGLGEAKGEQLYALYHEWTKKGLRRRARPFAPADKREFVQGEDLVEMAEEFAKRGWGEDTQRNFIRRQLRGRDKISTRGDLRKVLFAVRAMNRRDTEKNA